MLLTCRFRCSPRTKHFPHPGTLHTNVRPPDLPGPPPLPRRLEDPRAIDPPSSLSSSSSSSVPVATAAVYREGWTLTCGTFLPRLFLVRWGTGTGMGMDWFLRGRGLLLLPLLPPRMDEGDGPAAAASSCSTLELPADICARRSASAALIRFPALPFLARAEPRGGEREPE